MKTSDAVLEALARMSGDRNGITVFEWMQSEYETLKERIVFEEDDTQTRYLQGRARALSDILRDWSGARDILKRKRQ